MNEKMNVLDVQLDNCTAKDAMKIIAEYMQTEELNTVEYCYGGYPDESDTA